MSPLEVEVNFVKDTFIELVWISECHKKKQEVDFDLLCRLVPRTDKSCNLIPNKLALGNRAALIVNP